jgi:hypothetical protein
MTTHLDDLAHWIGRTEAFSDEASPSPLKALTAALDRNDPDPHLEGVV